MCGTDVGVGCAASRKRRFRCWTWRGSCSGSSRSRACSGRMLALGNGRFMLAVGNGGLEARIGVEQTFAPVVLQECVQYVVMVGGC
eukprot:3120892-Rhodomonas_salina.5